jgi:hypothetical protein
MFGFRAPRHWSFVALVVALAAGATIVTGPGAAGADLARTGGADAAARQGSARPRASLTIPESFAVIGHSFTISTKGSKAPAGLKSLVISFGDGEQVSGHETFVRVQHRYTEAGTFTVRLTVTDRLGRRDRIAQNIVVTHASGALPGGEEVTGEPLPQADALPARANLRRWSMPVQNQSPGLKPGIGSCVSWAIGYAMMGWYYRHNYGQNVEFAPMYIYSQHHRPVTDGEVGGMLATEALETLKTQGIDTREHYGDGWAYDYNTRPQQGDAKMQNAANYRISGYHTLFAHPKKGGASTAERYLIKASLTAAAPVAIAVRLRGDFDTYRSGLYRGREQLTGGRHEMLAVGYNPKGLLVQNSWGKDWGRNGYVLMSWRAVHRDLYEADVIDGLVTVTATPDTVAPTVTAPAKNIQAGTTMNDAGIPVHLAWQGNDDSGSVAAYRLYAKTNGSDWVQQTLGSPTATEITFTLQPGNNYQFGVAAVDAAGNVSQVSAGAAFTVGDYDDNSTYVGYYGTWERIAWSPADGGTLTTSSTPGSYATFSFVGSNVAWVAAEGANRGQARIYLDGAYVTTVDLYASAPVARYVAVHGNWSANESHTLAVEVVGTAGRPAIDIDSFVLLY